MSQFVSSGAWLIAVPLPTFLVSLVKCVDMFPLWGVKRSVAEELITAIVNSDQNRVQSVLNVCTALEVNYQGKKKHKQTALMHACRKGDEFIIQTLLSFPDVDVNLTDKVGNTALIFACEEGHVHAVRELLGRHEIDVNAISEGGNSALTWACILGHTAIARLLICHPAIDVNAKSPEADTPLIYAARHGRTEIVRMLVDHPNINILATDMHGTNALDATSDANIQMLLRKNGVAATPMRRPVYSAAPPSRDTSSARGNSSSSSPFQPTYESSWSVPVYPTASPQPSNTIAPFATPAEVQFVASADMATSHITTNEELQNALQNMQLEKSRMQDTILSLTSQNNAHLCTIQALQGTVQALTTQVASLQVQNQQLQSSAQRAW